MPYFIFGDREPFIGCVEELDKAFNWAEKYGLQILIDLHYCRAYDRMRRYLPAEKYIVIHDGFELMAWKDFMREEKHVNVVPDTHQYLMLAKAEGCPQKTEAYLSYIREHCEKEIAEMQNYFPVICGEWCLFNSRPFVPELRYTLGRETAIQKRMWTEDGWLRMADGSNLAKCEGAAGLCTDSHP